MWFPGGHTMRVEPTPPAVPRPGTKSPLSGRQNSVRVYLLWEILPGEDAYRETLTNPYWREAFPMSHLPEAIQCEIQYDIPHTKVPPVTTVVWNSYLCYLGGLLIASLLKPCALARLADPVEKGERKSPHRRIDVESKTLHA